MIGYCWYCCNRTLIWRQTRGYIFLTMFTIDYLNQWRHWPEHLHYRCWPAGGCDASCVCNSAIVRNLQRWRSLFSFYSFSSSSARINLLADQLNDTLISPKSPFRFGVCLCSFIEIPHLEVLTGQQKVGLLAEHTMTSCLDIMMSSWFHRQTFLKKLTFSSNINRKQVWEGFGLNWDTPSSEWPLNVRSEDHPKPAGSDWLALVL